MFLWPWNFKRLMQKKDAIIFQVKKQMTAKFIKKSQKIPGGKTANSGSRNSKKNNNINFVSTYPNILL